MVQAGWKVIHQYLKVRDPADFGIGNVRVTHAWTQDQRMTRLLCQACHISHPVARPVEMLGEVDAVIIARDDLGSRLPLALPFLKAGLPVFIDKPLSVDIEELRQLRPYLESGKLMSCSGMRYAPEMDSLRRNPKSLGALRLIRGTIVHSWEHYGIHLIDLASPLLSAPALSVYALRAAHTSVAVSLSDGSLFHIDTLGDSTPFYSLQIWGAEGRLDLEIRDRFTMFRRMLWHFFQSIQTGIPSIPPSETLEAMKILIAGRTSIQQKREVKMDEIRL
ncbi:Gfo/Idh/MocA family protein [Desmospora profundinema]|uniref:Dehydrogenase n=1 Tax=Desmospora profundinema TaxID=1571184 RepID=A0ABU1IRY5_9BACL|nr:Gfo/Idh/MocA family oxidoreductase [Desmospora profundinema]MDR6227498.1 putative dehydrogenase [Desmospora profundinema]